MTANTTQHITQQDESDVLSAFEDPSSSRPEAAELLYARLKLAHVEQLDAERAIQGYLRSPSQMIHNAEALAQLQRAQQQRALEIGALWLDVLKEQGSVSESLLAVSREDIGLLTTSLNSSPSTPVEQGASIDEAPIDEAPIDEAPIDEALAEDEPQLTSHLNQEELPQILRVIELPQAKPVSLDESELERLQQQMSLGGFQEEELADVEFNIRQQEVRDERLKVFELIKELEPLREIFGPQGFSEEYARLQRLIDPHHRRLWGSFPPKFQHKLTQHLTHRLRYLQERPIIDRPIHAQGAGAFESLFSGLSAHVSQRQTGWVNGLMLEHKPLSSSWFNDAKSSHEQLMKVSKDAERSELEELNPDQEVDRLRAMVAEGASDEDVINQVDLIVRHRLVPMNDQRLCAHLSEHQHLLAHYPQFKSLRSHVRRFEREQEEEETQFFSELNSSPHEFPLKEQLKGRHIVLVGGDRRQQSLTRLQDEFSECTFEWVDTSPKMGTRQIDSLCQSVAQGGVDAVLVIQSFVSHTVSGKLKDAVRASDHCESEMITRGYGFSRLSMALYKIAKRLKARALLA